jgi:hypothetical protein
MRQFERGDYDANVDTELFQEVLHRFWHREQIDRGIELFGVIADAFPDPFPITIREVTVARDILSDLRTIAPRDAIHAAVVVVQKLEGIISADGGFNAIPGVTRFDPMNL